MPSRRYYLNKDAAGRDLFLSIAGSCISWESFAAMTAVSEAVITLNDHSSELASIVLGQHCGKLFYVLMLGYLC